MNTRHLYLAALTVGLLGPAGFVHAADEPAAVAAPAAKPAPAPVVLTNVVVIAQPKTGEVLSPQIREHLLNVVGRDLNRANTTLESKLSDLTNPFFPKPPPAPVEPVPTPVVANVTAQGAPAVPVVVKLSDQDRLSQLAEKLKPSGTVVKGGQRVLVFTNNPPMSAGQSLRVRFPGDDKDSEVVLTEVTENSYTLKLNDAILPVPFNRPGASGTIQRAAPGTRPAAPASPATTPSKP
jgi:hypothetical protein